MTLRAKYWKLYQNFSPGAYALSFLLHCSSASQSVSALLQAPETKPTSSHHLTLTFPKTAFPLKFL